MKISSASLNGLSAYAATGSHRIGLRQLEILHLLRRGLSTRAIALELGIAWSTVRVYLHRLRRRVARWNATRTRAHARRATV